MLQTAFEQVLLLSVVGSAMVLVLFALRPITAKQFSPKWQYYIWLLALTALILPLPKPAAKVVYLPQTDPLLSAKYEPIQHLSDVLQAPLVQKAVAVDWMQLLSVIWAVGVLFVIALKLTRYAVFQSALSENSKPDNSMKDLPQRLKVRRTWLLDAPLLIGVFCPTLYLPESVSEDDLAYILAHELMHYKRRDLLLKWYAQLVFSLHWFNPLMLLLSEQIDAECEASCDFEVTRSWDTEETSSYMGMILARCSDGVRNRLLTTRMASGKRVLKRRFFAIRDGKAGGRKRRLLSVSLALLLFLTAQVFGIVLAKALWQETVIVSVAAQTLPEPQRETPQNAEIIVETPPSAETQPLPQEEPKTAAEQIVGLIEPVPVPTEKVLTYNSDERVVQTTTVYPDADGMIRIRFDSPEPRAVAELEIRNVDHPGGWGYTLPTDPATAYEFGGFDPNAAYAVTVNAYCPGNYGIIGSVAIY